MFPRSSIFLLSLVHAKLPLAGFSKLIDYNPQGHSSFLQRLFDIRKHFRLVAHQEPGSDPHSTALTCVDVVLAKISLLAMPLAVGPAIYDSDRMEGAEWIQLRRDNDIVRAATQLPGKLAFYNWLKSCAFLFR